MKLIKVSEDRYVNANLLKNINVVDSDGGYYILVEGHRWSWFREKESARKALDDLALFLEMGGTDLSVYRELDGFEDEVWQAYRKENRNPQDRLVAKCMLIMSDPDALVLMDVQSITNMLRDFGFYLYGTDRIQRFHQFLLDHIDNTEWFTMRV